MEVLLIHLAKSSGILLLFLGAYQLFLKKETYYMANRLFLLLGMILALLLPLLQVTKTVFIAPLPLPSTTVLVNGTPTEPLILAKAPTNWTPLIFGVYCLGVFITLSYFLVRLKTLRAFLAKESQHSKRGAFTYIETPTAASPFSFFKYIVYNPENFKKEELAYILAHEEVHARQWHSVDVLFTELITALLWFNPLIWFYRKAIAQNLEFLADAEATTLDTDKKAYQYLMLQQAVHKRQNGLQNAYYNSFIKKRIIMLNTKKSNRFSFLKLGIVIPLLIGFVLLFNVKTVAKIKPNTTQQTALKVPKPTAAKLYTITKNTTDQQLEELIKKTAADGEELSFTNIDRKNNVLTNIAISYDAKKAGKVTGNGTNENGIKDICFGVSEEGGVFINFNKEMLPYPLEDKPRPNKLLKQGEELNSSYTRTDAEGKLVTNHVKTIIKNGKEILYVNGKESTEAELSKLGIYSDQTTPELNKVKVIGYANSKAIQLTETGANATSSTNNNGPFPLGITKKSTDIELKTVKQLIEGKLGGKMTINKVKRNEHNLIVGINITYDHPQQGGAAYQFNQERSIPMILFSENNKGALDIYIHEPFDPNNPQTQISGTSGNVSIQIGIKPDSIKKHTIRTIERNPKDTIKSIAPLLNNISLNGRTTIGQSLDPLYFINGKEVSKAKMTKLNPDSIASISVLKNEQATQQYGKRAKNGVVLISLKKGKKPDFTPKTVQPAQSLGLNYIKMDEFNLKPERFEDALILINGKETTVEALKKTMPTATDSVRIYTGESAIKKFGQKGNKGVIEIFLTKKE